MPGCRSIFTFLPDTDRNTLDLIQSFEDALGGSDVISGNKGLDVGIGGTGDDTIFGDDLLATAGADDLGDLLLGDNADIFLVDDGGASGGDIKIVLSAAVKTIAERHAVLKLNTDFIEKHKETLAGMSWDVGFLDPEIKISCTSWYRGEQTTPVDIARLWPNANWKRERPEYRDNQLDYVAEVDGVKIIIKCAEVFKPVKLGKAGTRVKL